GDIGRDGVQPEVPQVGEALTPARARHSEVMQFTREQESVAGLEVLVRRDVRTAHSAFPPEGARPRTGRRESPERRYHVTHPDPLLGSLGSAKPGPSA